MRRTDCYVYYVFILMYSMCLKSAYFYNSNTAEYKSIPLAQ